MNHRIQKLRAIAVIAVIFYHAKESISPNGYLGVDVFFLISGYLVIPKMLSAIRAGNLYSFYRNRFYRLTPALVCMLLVCLFLILSFAGWSGISDYVNQAIFSIFYLANFSAVVLSGNYFSPDGFKPLLHMWSLSVEAQIYLLLPKIIQIKSMFVYLSIGIFSFLIFIVSPLLSNQISTWVFYMAISRFWEFMLGGFLVHLVQHRQFRKVNWKLLIYPLTFLLIMPVSINQTVSVILVITLTSFCLLNSRSSDHGGLLTSIGNRSYSIYLYHMPLMYVAKFSPLIYGNDRKIYTALSLIFTLILAEGSYRYIENCMRNISNKIA